MTSLLVLPRPGSAPSAAAPIPGPSEAEFTSTFGTLLPPAQHFQTSHGKAAYYEMLPAHPETNSKPDRVLFIHGVQTPALGMLPLARTLRSSFPGSHFVLLDLWGHGLSDTPVLPHQPSLFHELIDALLDHLSWPSAYLVGFSFGASLTTGYVVSRPKRVKSYVLVAPAGLRDSSKFTEKEWADMRGDDELAAQKWVLEWLEGGKLVVPTDWEDRVSRGEIVAEAVRKWQMVHHPGHTASVVAIVRDGGIIDRHEVFRDAARSGRPSLVVLGELDGLCSREQLLGFGFTDVEVVPGVGHSVVRDRAEEVAVFVGRFWRQEEM